MISLWITISHQTSPITEFELYPKKLMLANNSLFVNNPPSDRGKNFKDLEFQSVRLAVLLISFCYLYCNQRGAKEGTMLGSEWTLLATSKTNLLLLARKLGSSKEVMFEPLTILALVYQGWNLKIVTSLIKYDLTFMIMWNHSCTFKTFTKTYCW